MFRGINTQLALGLDTIKKAKGQAQVSMIDENIQKAQLPVFGDHCTKSGELDKINSEYILINTREIVPTSAFIHSRVLGIGMCEVSAPALMI